MAELAELSQRYAATPVGVFSARYGFVTELHRDNASPLVMRATADPGGHFQALAAEWFGVLGVGPVIYEIRTTATGTWTVMDRVYPGTAVEAGVSLTDLADLLRPIVADQSYLVGLPHLVPWLRERLVTREPADLPPGLEPAPAKEREHGLALLAELDDGQVGSLCHGDCSRENVLRSGAGLALIDPRGMVGDIAYDVAVLAAKTANSPASLARLLRIDPDRAQAWAVVAGAARV